MAGVWGEDRAGQVKIGKVGGAKMRAYHLHGRGGFCFRYNVKPLKPFKQARMGFDLWHGTGRSISKS